MTHKGKAASKWCVAEQVCRHLGLSPVRDVLAAGVELGPGLFHPRVEAVGGLPG